MRLEIGQSRWPSIDDIGACRNHAKPVVHVVAAKFGVAQEVLCASLATPEIAAVVGEVPDGQRRIRRLIARSLGMQFLEGGLQEVWVTQCSLAAHLVRRPAFLRDALPSGRGRQATLARLGYFLVTKEGTNLVGGLDQVHGRSARKAKTRRQLSSAGKNVGEDQRL